MKLRLSAIVATAILLLSSAVPARADVTLTPFVGSLFKGDLPTSRFAYGGSVTFTAGGIFGGEIEGTFAPKFIERTSVTPEVHHANVMGNVIIAIPVGGTSGKSVRPYVAGGIGLFRTTAKNGDFFDRIRANDFAYNFGGGVMAFFTDAVGLRVDLRYFQSLRDQDTGTGVSLHKGDLNFWRWSVGPSFKF